MNNDYIQAKKRYKRFKEYNYDAYFTPLEVIHYCIDILKSKINLDDIDIIIEPSCGDGRFIKEFIKLYPEKFYIGIDINDFINKNEFKYKNFVFIQDDFLKSNVFKALLPDYRIYYNKIFNEKDRILFIGNPPYTHINKSENIDWGFFLKFLSKAKKVGKYILFILPESSYNKEYHNLKLLHSEKLGKLSFDIINKDVTNQKEVSVCLNLYENIPYYKSKKIESYYFRKIYKCIQSSRLENHIAIKRFFYEYNKRKNSINSYDFAFKNIGHPNRKKLILKLPEQEHLLKPNYYIISIKPEYKNLRNKIIKLLLEYKWENHKKNNFFTIGISEFKSITNKILSKEIKIKEDGNYNENQILLF